jgi:hypothetical protein
VWNILRDEECLHSNTYFYKVMFFLVLHMYDQIYMQYHTVYERCIIRTFLEKFFLAVLCEKCLHQDITWGKCRKCSLPYSMQWDFYDRLFSEGGNVLCSIIKVKDIILRIFPEGKNTLCY